MHRTYTDVLIVMHEKNKTESSLYTSTLLLGMHGAAVADLGGGGGGSRGAKEPL